MKQTKPQKIYCVFNYIFLTIVGLICLLPMLNIIALSFSSRNMVNAGVVTFWPMGFTTRSYQYMIESSGLLTAAWVTVKRVVLGLLINLSMTVLVAYPLSKEKHIFRSRTFYVGFFLFAMIFNGGLIPTYLMINELRMIDSIWALILPNAVTMYYVLLMLNFFRGIPRGIEEAAIVDGAGWFTTLVKIYLPLSLPSLATITLFTAVGQWNSFSDTLLYITDKRLYTLQYILQMYFRQADALAKQLANGVMDSSMIENMVGSISTNSIRLTITVIVTFPIMCVYPFVQKYFMKGIMVGAVKG